MAKAHGKARRVAREILLQGALVLATLAALELILILNQPKYLFPEKNDAQSHGYRYDAELGWSPIPGAKSGDVEVNSLGIRDSEPDGSKPKILFIGDSMVWGYSAKSGERFTELLKPQFPGYQVLNAGVSGYGTDQEYLMLRRLWDATRPVVVVLTFCQINDRHENRRSLRYNYFKPYLVETAPGVWEFRGQPPPPSRRQYIAQSWVAQHYMIGRLAMSAYVEVRHRRVIVPDPTERLVGMIRDFVHGNGARLLVGITDPDPQLEAYLKQENIPFVNFQGEDIYDGTRHWTVAGNVYVAERYAALLSAHGIARAVPAAAGGREP